MVIKLFCIGYNALFSLSLSLSLSLYIYIYIYIYHYVSVLLNLLITAVCAGLLKTKLMLVGLINCYFLLRTCYLIGTQRMRNPALKQTRNPTYEPMTKREEIQNGKMPWGDGWTDRPSYFWFIPVLSFYYVLVRMVGSISGCGTRCLAGARSTTNRVDHVLN